jgi:hypothetical protein
MLLFNLRSEVTRELSTFQDPWRIPPSDSKVAVLSPPTYTSRAFPLSTFSRMYVLDVVKTAVLACPPSRTFAAMLIAEPKRAKLRTDMEEPKVQTSRRESDEPIFAMPSREIALPRRAKDLKEIDEPTLA